MRECKVSSRMFKTIFTGSLYQFYENRIAHGESGRSVGEAMACRVFALAHLTLVPTLLASHHPQQSSETKAVACRYRVVKNSTNLSFLGATCTGNHALAKFEEYGILISGHHVVLRTILYPGNIHCLATGRCVTSSDEQPCLSRVLVKPSGIRCSSRTRSFWLALSFSGRSVFSTRIMHRSASAVELIAAPSSNGIHKTQNTACSSWSAGTPTAVPMRQCFRQ